MVRVLGVRITSLDSSMDCEPLTGVESSDEGWPKPDVSQPASRGRQRRFFFLVCLSDFPECMKQLKQV